MNVKVISIPEEYEALLSFLFPTYSCADSALSTSKFIAHRDVKSKRERETLDLYYQDAVFISTQIFDEFWDEEKLKSLVVEFSRVNFKNRKKSYEYTKETFVKDSLDFMFGIIPDEQEASIFELFDAFGSMNFVKKYLEKSLQIPIAILNSSLDTFLTKILTDRTSVYYRKKNMTLGDKIKRNLSSSLDALIFREKDNLGLSTVKFYLDLLNE